MTDQTTPSTADAPNDGLFGTRRRLGRGLNSLLGQAGDQPGQEPAAATSQSELLNIDINALHRNPFQPRKDFDLQALNELTESVAQHGVLQPLLVRETATGYQIIAGERRWLAARDAGLKNVPCRIMKLEDKVMSEVAIIENLQREDLNELEKAQAFQTYLDQFGCSVEELAHKMGKDRSTIANSLRLLELPQFVKESLRSGKISAGHGRALLGLSDESEQIAMCQRIQSETMSVRATEAAVREIEQAKDGALDRQRDPSKPAGPKEKFMTAHVLQLQDAVRQMVGTKVELKMSGKDSGKLVIHFKTNDEFENVLSHFKKAG